MTRCIRAAAIPTPPWRTLNPRAPGAVGHDAQATHLPATTPQATAAQATATIEAAVMAVDEEHNRQTTAPTTHATARATTNTPQPQARAANTPRHRRADASEEAEMPTRQQH